MCTICSSTVVHFPSTSRPWKALRGLSGWCYTPNLVTESDSSKVTLFLYNDISLLVSKQSSPAAGSSTPAAVESIYCSVITWPQNSAFNIVIGRPEKGCLISQIYILKNRVNWVLLEKKFRLSRVPGSVLWIDKSWLYEAPIQKTSTDQTSSSNFKEDLFRALALKWNLVFSPISPNSKIHNKGSYHFFQNIHPCFLYIVDITIEQWYMEIVGKYCTRIYKHLFIYCGGHLRVTAVGGHQVTYYLEEPCL